MRLRKYLPMLRLIKKAIPVIIEKQLLLSSRNIRSSTIKLNKSSWIYWYNPFDFIRIILLATKLRAKMYFDMAYLVIFPTEFWHSRA